MTDKPRYRAKFEGGALTAKPIVRASLPLPTVPKGDEVTAELRWQRFQDAGPGNPDIDYHPTATIDPSDPRTNHIRYWHNERVMTIEWGDGGTPYAYYDVTPSEARRMTEVKSPGRFINRVLNNKMYGPIQ